MEEVKVKIKILPNADGIVPPEYATTGSAGVDLRAAEPCELQPDLVFSVPTGIALEIPPGFEAQIRPRSGLASKYQITILNSPGTIDSDYRGEIRVLLISFGGWYWIERGDRIAQLVFSRVARVNFERVGEIGETERGAGGFGSTGK